LKVGERELIETETRPFETKSADRKSFPFTSPLVVQTSSKQARLLLWLDQVTLQPFFPLSILHLFVALIKTFLRSFNLFLLGAFFIGMGASLTVLFQSANKVFSLSA